MIGRRPPSFAGRLVEKHTGNLHGLHQTQLRLIDDDGGSHIVYIAHGRGAVAAFNAQREFERLEIGARYHGHATLFSAGNDHTYWMGQVSQLQIDRRAARARPATQQETTA
ncbi:MAG: hypothetical protein RJA36_1852 [Pseudomonadota bacterium]|jgi:hypothetical protein